jgi:hypothetical protein
MPTDAGTECKVDRVSRRRDLSGIDERLCERRSDGASLRDLERVFNVAVLRAATRAAGMETLDGEVENFYRLLTDETVTPGERVDAESRLRRAGVDPDAVVGDFVSYGTVRTHLNDCLGVGTARERTGTVADARSTVYKLVSRTESVARRTVERLADRGSLAIGPPSVTVSVRVACSDCNDEFAFSELLDERRCSCRED